MIEKLFCLSLTESTQRRALMKNQFKKLEEDHQLDWEFADGVKYDDDEVYNTMRHLTNVSKRTSVVAISLGYNKIMKKIYDNKYTMAAVAEDDVVIKDDLYDKVQLYLDNTPEVLESMKNEPCIIFLSGINSIKIQQHPNAFVDIGPQAGLYFFIINHQAAKIMLDNLYPIRSAYDGYMINIVKKYSIKTYSALPILAYDLSSPFFMKCWTEEDKKIKKNIRSLSMINDVKMLTHNIVYDGQNTNFSDLLNICISKKFTNNNINYYKQGCSDEHFLFIGSTLESFCNSNSVICGTGIETMLDVFNEPKAVSFVRGPLTRQRFIELGYKCPEIYGDPVLILSKIYNPIISKKYKVGIIPYYKEFSKVKSNVDSWNLKDRTSTVVVVDFNIDYDSIIDTINSILSCNYILTSSLYGLILAHTYNIPAIWIKSTDDDNSQYKFKDYLASLNIQDLNPLTFNKKLLDNVEETSKRYPTPDRKRIDNLIKNVLTHTLFNKKLNRIE